MAKKTKRETELVDQMRRAIEEIELLAPSLSKPASKKVRESLDELKTNLNRAVTKLDTVRIPSSWFDPADPNTAGRLVAAALLAQPRIPLDLVPRSYGAGVYAIYYNGNFPAYAPISKTETPIYVGKADPQSATATSPREQGQKLSGRLADHRKVIRSVEAYASANLLPNSLRIVDFECRRLVTATNAQMFAERHLISLFAPIWNSDADICWGISMHGDKDARSNDRPPWHVLHPGRAWALAPKLAVSRPAVRILADIATHFETHPSHKDRDEAIERFLEAFAQDPMTAIAPVDDDEAEIEDTMTENDQSS